MRVQVDGVNTTEGTGSAGFYYDYGSLQEIQLGGDGMDAQSATPGVQLNAVIKVGRQPVGAARSTATTRTGLAGHQG